MYFLVEVNGYDNVDSRQFVGATKYIDKAVGLLYARNYVLTPLAHWWFAEVGDLLSLKIDRTAQTCVVVTSNTNTSSSLRMHGTSAILTSSHTLPEHRCQHSPPACTSLMPCAAGRCPPLLRILSSLTKFQY